MITKSFTVIEQGGLHARPAALLVQAAGKFDSEINLEYKSRKANLKSIMGVMAMGIPQGSEFSISAEGSDEETAIASLHETLDKAGLAK